MIPTVARKELQLVERRKICGEVTAFQVETSR